MSDPLVIVISGQVSAGKTTAGKMLRDQGFQYARISQAIRSRWNGPNGSKPPRSWYQEVGMELHETIGQRALCEETIKLIPDASQSFVIDGVRWEDDVQYFRERYGKRLVHIHLVADAKTRKQRFEHREKDVSFEKADGHDVEQGVASLERIADAVFDNSRDDEAALRGFLGRVITGNADAC